MTHNKYNYKYFYDYSTSVKMPLNQQQPNKQLEIYIRSYLVFF